MSLSGKQRVYSLHLLAAKTMFNGIIQTNQSEYCRDALHSTSRVLSGIRINSVLMDEIDVWFTDCIGS